MKKKLMTLFTACVVTTMAAEIPSGLEVLNKSPLKSLKSEKVFNPKFNTRAESTKQFTFGYCYDLSNFLGMYGSVMEGAIEIPEELASKWIGAKIVAVNIGFGVSSDKQVMVYLTEDLQGMPFYMQNATMKTQQAWNRVDLTTPYTIDGTPFFVGYQATCNAQTDYPIGVDEVTPDNEYGDYIVIDNEIFKSGEIYGDVCLQIVLEGDDLPENNVSLAGLDLPGFVRLEQPFAVGVYFKNGGVNKVETLSIEYTLDGKAAGSEDITLDEPVESGEFGWAYFNAKSDIMGAGFPISVSVVKVNGVPDDDDSDNVTTAYIACSDIGYESNVVVEEFTGTWCGWCPRGIVGMKYMKENYGDKGFIGVAVHYNDQMQSDTYVEINNRYSQGSWPSAVANRAFYFDPSAETMETYYKFIRSFESYVNVGVEASYNATDKVVNVKGSCQFALDLTDAGYKFAFGLTEDGVGPYTQTNNFNSVAAGGVLEGWNGAGSKVSTIYNEVAINITDPFGIDNSIPATIEKGKTYTWEAVIPATAVEDIDNCDVVAMVLDNYNGQVVNATKIAMRNHDAGVEGIYADKADSVLKVYNTQGVKVLETEDSSALSNLPKGIYIINGKKAMIK